MNKKFMFILVFIIMVLLTIISVFGDYTEYLTEIDYSALESKMSKNEDFILYIKQDNCSHCANFTPKFEKVLNSYKVKAYYINLTYLTDEEKTNLNDIVSVTGTPMVFFFEEGEPISTKIDGNKSKEVIISKLKVTNYIKEK